jgi:hypothetical protein
MMRSLLLLVLVCLSLSETWAVEKKKFMKGVYLSRYYKGFLLQQTDTGWIIVNAPSRTPSGPLSPGPYSTDGIAAHVVDRIIRDSERR